jgi:hypothetical protein
MGKRTVWGMLWTVTLASVAAIAACGLLVPVRSQAAIGINQQVNFQARLLTASGAVVADGLYNLEFKLVQDGNGCNPTSGTFPCGGSVQWTETRKQTNRVTVKNGYFSVSLGAVTALPTSIWNQDTLWLSINIGGTADTATPTWDGEMKPLKRLSSSPYALNSGQLGGLTSGNFVQLAQGLQTDSSNANASIAINKTGSASMLQFQQAGADVLTLDNAGALTTTYRGTASALTVDTTNATADGVSIDIAGSTASEFALRVTSNNGATNGLYVRADGNVGIGTTTPLAKLHVVGPSGVTSFTGGTNLGINVTGSTGLTDYSGIDFSGSSNLPAARIATLRTGSGSYLQFGTSNNYGLGITNTAMTIDYNGNVGIGTPTPVTKLEVVDTVQQTVFAGTSKGQIHVRSTTATGDYSALTFGSSAGQPGAKMAFQQTAAGGMLQFGTTNNYGAGITNTAMTIDPTGSIGIGTAAPVQKLDVSVATNPVIRLNNSAATLTTGNNLGGIEMYTNDGSTNATGVVASIGTIAESDFTANNGIVGLQLFTKDGLTLSEKMRIRGNGNVGIGTTIPNVKLEVAGIGRFTDATGFSIGSDANQNRIQTSATNQTFRFLSTTNSSTGIAVQSASVGSSYFNTTAPTNGLIVEGNVGIGTSTVLAGSILDVNGNVNLSGSNRSLFFRRVDGTTLSGTITTNASNSQFEINSNNGILALLSRDGVAINQSVGTVSTQRALTVTAAAHTAMAASTENSDIYLNLARNVTWATGALATQRAIRIDAPTYAFAGASTITDAVTMNISGPPIRGTNATVTNSYGLRIQGGSSGTATNTYGLSVAAPSNGANAYSAVFTGGNVGIGTTAPITRLANSATLNTGAVSTLGINWQISDTAKYVASFKNISGTGHGIHIEATGGNGLIVESGNVGIGDTTPLNKLTIQDTATNNTITNSLRIYQPGTGTGTGAAIELGYGDTATATAQIAGVYDGAGRAITFSTGTGVAAYTEKMRIDNAGNVGIGTTTPATTLSVTKTFSASDWVPVVSGNSGRIGTYATITPTTNVTGVLVLLPTQNRTADGTGTLSYDSTAKTLTWKSGTAITISSTNNASYLLPDGSGGTIIAAVTAGSLPGTNQSDVNITISTAAATAGFGLGERDTSRGAFIFNDDIYLGFENDTSDIGEAWRSRDGLNWVKVTDSFGAGTAVDHIDRFYLYNGYLYGSSASSGTIYRSKDGNLWSLAGTAGSGNTVAFAEFRGRLYVTSFNGTAGSVHSTTNGTNWTESMNFGTSRGGLVNQLVKHNGRLYATYGSLGASADGVIYSTADGTNWSQSGTDGFGNGNNNDIFALTSFNEYIYAGTFNSVEGAEVHRSLDGATWEKVMTGGFGSINNKFIYDLIPYNGYLYAGTDNAVTGGQIWRSSDGRNWSQANVSAFGEAKEQKIRSFFVFRGQLYANGQNDTSNTGTELWRLQTGVIEAPSGGLYAQSIQTGGVTLQNNILTGLTSLQSQSGILGALGVSQDLTVSGNIGLGIMAPTSKLHVVAEPQTVASAANGEYTTGTFTAPTITLTGTTQVTSTMDSFLFNQPTITSASAVTVDKASTMTIAGAPMSAGSVTLVDSYGLKINSASVTAATRATSLFVEAPTGATNNYAAVFSSGNVGIGTIDPTSKLVVMSGTKTTTAHAQDSIRLVTTDASNPLTLQLALSGHATDSSRYAKIDVYEAGLAARHLALQTSGGNVGIGTIAPGSKLDVYNATGTSNTDLFRLLSDVGGTSNVKFRVDSDGDIFTDGSITIGTPADLAEKYANHDNAQPGHVVVFTNASTVAKSTTPHQKGLAGVISTDPGLTLSGTTTGVPVALSGRVPVKVTTANGPITPGDYLTSGPNGTAQKATTAGPTIGTALEATTTDGTIEVFIHLDHYAPTGTETTQAQATSPQATTTGTGTFSSLNVSGTTMLTSLTVTGPATIQGNLTVQGTTTVVDLVVEGHIAVSKDTGGTVTVASGSDSFEYSFAAPYTTAPEVIITSKQNSGNLNYWVETTKDGFTVHLSQDAASDLDFSYFVIEPN